MKILIVFFLILSGGFCLFLPGPVKAAESGPATEGRIMIATHHNGKNPCAMKNPCSMKSGAGNMMMKPIRKTAFKNKAEALKYGEKLWKDDKLGLAGVSCSSCHPGGAQLKNKPYPRYVEMTGDIVTLDQMINFCMTNPMQGEALKWNSKRLTALAAYVQKHTPKDGNKNPCAMKNPCSMKHR